MDEKAKLTCCHCDWETTVETKDPRTAASSAAIDHHLIFGHSIERVITAEHKQNVDLE
jgi:hypothetical protein